MGPERGGADCVRDVRGWALKLYTEEGNQDWVFNDIVSTRQLSWNEGVLTRVSKARVFCQRSDQVPLTEQITQATPTDKLA